MTSNEKMGGLPGASSEGAPVWQATLNTEAAGDQGDAAAGATTDGAEGGELAGPIAMPPSRIPARAPARRNRSTTGLLLVGALIALGGIGFAAGRATGGSSTTTTNNDGGFNFGANGSFNPGNIRPDGSGFPDIRGGDALGSSTVSGTVVSVTADTMTVQLADGQTVTVSLGSSTTYHSQTSASSSSVTTGSTVIVKTGSSTTGAAASASAGTGTNRTATDITVTSN